MTASPCCQPMLTPLGSSTTVDSMAPGFDIPSPDDPAAALAAVVALRRLADQLEHSAVEQAVGQGWTWNQVAQALGVTRQAAHKKFAHRIGRR